jgi:hypothetical protein
MQMILSQTDTDVGLLMLNRAISKWPLVPGEAREIGTGSTQQRCIGTAEMLADTVEEMSLYLRTRRWRPYGYGVIICNVMWYHILAGSTGLVMGGNRHHPCRLCLRQ